MLTADALKQLVHEQQACGVVLGGSALFRADGLTHFGARKLVSGIMGVIYESDWLPKVVPGGGQLPVWLCRENLDDPVTLVERYVQRHLQAQ